MFRIHTILFGLIFGSLFSFNGLLAQTAYHNDYDDDGHHEFEIKGYIDAINGDTIIVKGYSFVVDSTTTIQKHKDMTLTLDDLAVGNFVEVEGISIDDSLFLAKKIKLEDDEYEHHYELEIKGMIETIGMDYIEVGGYRFMVNDETRISGGHRTVLQFSDLAVDMYVEVEGYLQADGTYLAKKISLDDNDEEECRFEFKGQIDSIETNYIVVDSMRFYLDSNTTYYKDRHDPADYSDLLIGSKVEIKATLQDDGTYLALRIKIKNDRNERMVFTGVIDSVGTDFIFVFGYKIIIDSYTDIYNYRHDAQSFLDLVKGLRVKVKGYLQNDGTIKAYDIKIRAFWQDYAEFKGIVEAVGNDWLTVNGVQFYIDSTSKIYNQHKEMISLDQVATGYMVEIKALHQSDDTWLAAYVKIEDNHYGEIEITGSIESIGEDTLVVEGITFFTDEYTMIMGFKGEPLNFSDLSVNQIVEVEGYLKPDGSYYAKKIKLEDDSNMYVFSGTIDAKSNRSVMISNNNISLNNETTILNESYVPTNLSEIALGSVVTVWVLTGDHNNQDALQIKLGTISSATNLTDRSNSADIPQLFTLEANYPNPFNPGTTIPFIIHAQSQNRVELTIYNVLGQKVKTLFKGFLNTGSYEFKWDATTNSGQNVPSGSYFYQLKIGNKQQVKRMMLLR